MLHLDEDALICDFAETYRVYDWRGLPLKTAAALAAGLRDGSRIRMQITGDRIDLTTTLLARAVDSLNLLWWARTTDGRNGRNPPKSVLGLLMKAPEESDVEAFASGEDFMEARKMILETAR